MDEYAIRWGATRDRSDVIYDGSIVKSREYIFWIGKHGPLTERVPLDHFDPDEINRRVEAVRAHLRALVT